MRTESKQTARVRAVLLSLLMVLSVIGGAAAVVGGTDTDGSITDDVDDTLTPTSDDDTIQLDDEDSSDGDSTTDDGGSGGTTTDGTEDTTTSDTDDTGSGGDGALSGDGATDATDGVSRTDAGSTVAETGDTVTDASTDVIRTGSLETNILGVAGTYLLGGPGPATQQSAATADGGSGSTGAGANHDSVGITAGATNQSAIATAGEGAATFAVTESEAGAFPANGTATLGLPADSGVTFDTNNTSAVATADNATATVTEVTATTISIAVTSTDENATSGIALTGLRFTAGAEATAVNATWTFGDTSAATAVEPERLEVLAFGDKLARGAHGAPENGTAAYVQAPPSARTEGFVAADRNLALRIPDELQDDISFDTSASLSVRSDDGDCDLPVIGYEFREEYYSITDDQILVQVTCEIGSDEYVQIEGIRFNVSGADAGTPAEFEGQLVAKYQPVDRIDQPVVDAGDPVTAHAPAVSASSTSVQTNATNVTGDSGVSVSVADDIGGLMADGSRITVELQDTGVTFNESQTFEATVVEGDATAPSVVSANGTTVVLETRGTTDAGDEFRLQRAGGGAIRFDVGANATDTALRVTTSPGAEDVTQATGTVVAVRSECASILAAVDENGDGRIGDFELLDASSMWRDQEAVPGTCGKTIGDFDLLDITEQWRSGQNGESQS